MNKYQIELTSGVVVEVTPATPALNARVEQQAMTKFPFDTTPFERTVEGTAFTDDKKVVDRESTEFQVAAMQIISERNTWRENRLIEALVKPVGVTKDELIQAYKDDLPALRDIANDHDSTDWFATLKYCLIATREDNKAITQALHYKLPVKEAEIDEALGIFRHVVQRAYMAQPETNQNGSGNESTANGQW